MFIKLGLIQCLIILSAPIFGQLYVKGNTNLVVPSNSSINIRSVSDSIYVETGSSVNNNGVIHLEEHGMINDHESPLYGNGFEESYKLMFSNPGSFDHGGLGFITNGVPSTDSIIVQRYHNSMIVKGMTSINRSYTVFSQINMSTSQQVSIKYHPSELNGILENDLSLAHESEVSHWRFYNPGVNTWSQTTFFAGVDSLNGVYTLVDSSGWTSVAPDNISNVTIYPTILHAGDVINFIFPTDPDIHLNLLSSSGSLIVSDHAQETYYQMTLPDNLTKGMYTLVCRSKETAFIKRIVIN